MRFCRTRTLPTGEALTKRAEKLGVSLDALFSASGVRNETELQRRVLEAERARREGGLVAARAAVRAGVHRGVVCDETPKSEWSGHRCISLKSVPRNSWGRWSRRAVETPDVLTGALSRPILSHPLASRFQRDAEWVKSRDLTVD